MRECTLPDGAPLPEAFVKFVPTGGQGTTSSGRTDRNGNYQLMLSRTASGASLGTSTVRITTREVVADDQGRGTWLPEKVPSCYNSESELSVEVEPGSNRLDFDLRSDGTTDEKSNLGAFPCSTLFCRHYFAVPLLQDCC